jgi:hypothetical protein
MQMLFVRNMKLRRLQKPGLSKVKRAPHFASPLLNGNCTDLDRFEMAAQAYEYERAHGKELQPFFDSSLPVLRHPEVRSWGEDLAKERAALRSAGEHQ